VFGGDSRPSAAQSKIFHRLKHLAQWHTQWIHPTHRHRPDHRTNRNKLGHYFVSKQETTVILTLVPCIFDYFYNETKMYNLSTNYFTALTCFNTTVSSSGSSQLERAKLRMYEYVNAFVGNTIWNFTNVLCCWTSMFKTIKIS
jgi:hypothetical protein